MSIVTLKESALDWMFASAAAATAAGIAIVDDDVLSSFNAN